VNKVTIGVLAAAVALFALVAGYFVHIWWAEPRQSDDPAKVLLAAPLVDGAGARQPIAQWSGKVVVVNFWATWCPPCIKEIPEFIALQRDYADRGVQFVGIAIDDKPKAIAFAAKVGINYPTLFAERDGIELVRLAGNRLGGLPFTVIIDRTGRTARVELGALDRARLEPLLKQIL